MELKNISCHEYTLNKEKRCKIKKHKSILIWLTGLSGSGKSTIANALEIEFFRMNIHTYTLDGDNVRSGLNKDLTFSPEDRSENIRRIAETSKLMLDAGLVVIAAFITPYARDRQLVKNIIGFDEVVEIFVDTPLAECERRDVKGLYKKARANEIKNMTGIDSPYENPVAPDITVNTLEESLIDSVNKIIEFTMPKLTLNTETLNQLVH
ncbi:adenylyl-sulfate kinase [Flavobacterium sp. Leaf82]|jgi:adenylylsulfate kinase|uniref:adenylyl-sulfate kinase n=1 Tax=unclassified Flavobacterium TaxID=196869 RepID=UPI0006F3D7BF|nr:adenylyl-sulfate kinase [Flavobacterium sp. Leaf82]KQO31333.1 adenylyl-sulfate kinase [Flavobacterium sp. Leaf82]